MIPLAQTPFGMALESGASRYTPGDGQSQSPDRQGKRRSARDIEDALRGQHAPPRGALVVEGGSESGVERGEAPRASGYGAVRRGA